VVLGQKKIDAVLVGADRIAANGDTANKIGTFSLAIAAKHFNVPFYVVAPISTVDLKTPSGEQIPIEERAAAEVANFAAQPTAPAGVDVFNPAFDVTPAALIRGIITENGVAKPPFTQSLARLCRGYPS
jgi:methylthioribose-1-phosphate isomerase